MFNVNDSKNETITRSLSDENGRLIATFSVNRSSENPMGSYSAWVQDKAIYTENKEEIDGLYSSFKAEC